MIPANEHKIVSRWHDWFDVHGDFRRTAMPRGFQCGDGWFDLVYRLCERLEPLVRELNSSLQHSDRFEVLQVKQKFGELRFYVSHDTAAIDAEIGLAQQKSLSTCENCGLPGTLGNKDGWLLTRCDECLKVGGRSENGGIVRL